MAYADEQQRLEYARQYGRRYRQEQYEKCRETQRRIRARYRDEALDALGGCCAVCGLDERAILDFDHVAGNGADDRRSRSDYARLKAIAGGEEGWQLLCPNDHRRKTIANGDHLR